MIPSSPARDLRDGLRSETRSAHARVEAAVEAMQPFDSPVAYRRLLTTLLSVYEPLEAALYADAGWRAIVADHSARHKVPLLRADLATLRRVTGPAAPSRRRSAIGCAWLRTSTGHALGCSYVLEGATLGGLGLRNRAAALSAPACDAVRFFGTYGRRKASMWDAFLRSASAWPHASDIRAGARATFAAFEIALVTERSDVECSVRRPHPVG